MQLAITVDPTGIEPLQRQLYNEIRAGILVGRLARGMKLPPSRELARSLGISRTTVTLVYDALVSEGYLDGKIGAGTFVASELPDELMEARAQPFVPFEPSALCREQVFDTLSDFGRHLAKTELLGSSSDPEIQFAFGRPDMDSFPISAWLRLLNMHCKRKQFSQLDMPKRSQGYAPLREALARYLGRARGMKVDAGQIVIVNGSQQAMDLVSRAFVERGDYVGLEDPCWVGAKTIFEAHGARCFPVAVDKDGISTTQLLQGDTPRLKFLYLTPSHQFPTGASLSLSRRLELLGWAQRTNTFIVEDDYDSEIRYRGKPVPALAGLDNNNRVIYIGTFSKVLFVSLRLGYMVVPPDLVHVFTHGKWLTDRHSPILEQQVLADFIDQGHLERHVRRMRKVYEERRGVLIAALRRYFGKRVQVVGEDAGIHVLVHFQTKMSEQEVVDRALELGVGILPSMHFATNRSGASFIMNYGALSSEQINEGVKRLAQVVE